MRATLTAYKGVGNWTADIYLLFCLGRRDAFAPGDLVAAGTTLYFSAEEGGARSLWKYAGGTSAEKMFMGPIWDFNLGFGNVNFCAKDKPEGFIIYYNRICPEDGWLIPFWWDRLFEDPAFKAKVVARWTSLRGGVYQNTRVMNFIDSVASVLNVESQQRNFQRWPVLGQYVWPNAFIGNTFDSEVSFLKDWTTKRLAWIDANIQGIVTGVVPSKEEDSFQFVAHPNPFRESLTLRYQIDQPGSVVVEVIDIQGRLIDTHKRIHSIAGVYEMDLTSEKLTQGLFIIKAQFGQEKKVTKVVRQGN